MFPCYKQSVGRYLFAIALVLSATLSLFAQCPSGGTETEARTLRGRLIFLDGIEQWFELKLDQPQCGDAFIELFEQGSNSLAILRGCRVKSEGALIISARGNIRQIVKEIEAVGPCVHKAPFPDFSNVKPDSAIREYRVEMHLNGNHPIHFRVSQAGKALRPWQAYSKRREAPPTWRRLISIGQQGWAKRTQTWASRASGPNHEPAPKLKRLGSYNAAHLGTGGQA